MKQYSKLRVGLKEHLKDIKGAPLSVFVVMTLTCDKCGVFFQPMKNICEMIGYERVTVWRAHQLLEKKGFIKKLASVENSSVWLVPKHDPKMEALVFMKGEKYLVDKSTVLRNLGIKHVSPMKQVVSQTKQGVSPMKQVVSHMKPPYI